MSTFSISFDTNVVKFGTITGFSQTFNKNVASTPIVSKSALETYQIETGNTMTYSISFSRNEPENADDNDPDSDMWHNVAWYELVTNLINRWQARTDGCTITFEPDANDIYVPKMSENGYIRSISRTYGNSFNGQITGEIEFTVGRMYVQNDRNVDKSYGYYSLMQSTNIDDMYIMMSNVDGNTWYSLLYCGKSSDGNDIDIRCVNSYELCGGVEQPFEYVKMELSKKALSTVASALTDDGGIVAGRNKLMIRAAGICNNFIVSACSMNSDTFSITAYCGAEVIRGYTMGSETTMTPMDTITLILSSGSYGVRFYPGSTLISNVDDKEYEVVTKADTNVWIALQACAYALGAKVFFLGDKAFVIDCEKYYSPSADKATVWIDDIDRLVLDTEDTSNFMYARVKGKATLGNEGTKTIVNKVKVSTISSSGQYSGSATETDELSIEKYGCHEYGSFPQICDSTNGNTFCSDIGKTIIKYRKAPQQSIKFTVGEAYSSGPDSRVWKQLFAPITRVREISDEKDDATVYRTKIIKETIGGGTVVYEYPQSLMLSQFTHNYPDMTTTYEFGVISNTDLAEFAASNSNILKARGA